ncbi:MAG: hypothetical protein EPO01_06680 [Aquabacterium sp.]|nr:MAG: hypothetical protein EPO01_06680 [Aquabacterium sp.]
MSTAVVAAAGSPWLRKAAAGAGIVWLALAFCRPGAAHAEPASAAAISTWPLFQESAIDPRRFGTPGLGRDWPNGARVSWPEFFWVDAGQAVATLWRKDGWEAAATELPRNWIFDVRRGSARRLEPDGQIVCAHEGRIVFLSSPVEGQGRLIADAPPPDDTSRLSAGHAGSPPGSFAIFARARGIDAAHPLSRATCDAAPAPADIDPDRRSSVLRLGEGRLLAIDDRGRAADLRDGAPARPPPRWTVLDARGQVLSRWEHACARANWPHLQRDLQPVPWLGGTASLRSAAPRPGAPACPWVIVRDDGQVQPLFDLPPALQRLPASAYARELAGISAQGPVWIVTRTQALADARHAGLFIQDGARLTKVLSDEIHPLGPLSPDGCLLPAAITPEGTGLANAKTWGATRRAATFHAIDFCKGDQ